jgi:hypothetical protein
MDASKLIDKRIADTKDWRGKIMATLRKLVHEADPDITEEWKWDSPIFSHDGLVLSIGCFKDYAGANFFQGASLKDPKKILNHGLEAKKTRVMKLVEGDKVNEKAFKELVKAAVAFNTGKGK